jgi:flagellar L-ring protein precursor FlgH
MKNLPFVLIFLALFLTSCSKTPMDPKIDMKPPTYVQELPPKIENNVKSNPGSLFGKGDNPLFSDRKAMKVNDILTVVIEEKTALSSSSKKSVSGENENTLGAGAFTGPSVASKLNQLSSLGFSSSSEKSFTGQGSNTRDESFTTNITARVVKILANGNYFIEGKKELLINGEKQIFQITGTIRPYDIDETNTINSKHIADAKIFYDTQGELKRITTKPWGSKILEAIWPF